MTSDFGDAVVEQVRRLGGDAKAAEAMIDRLLERDHDEGLASVLATRHALLAAVFQNIDLLYSAEHPAADAVARTIMLAVSELEAGPG